MSSVYKLKTTYYLWFHKKAELQEKLRRRRKIQNDDDSDDVDDGLPRSPSMHSPTIATGNDLLLSKVRTEYNIHISYIYTVLIII